ncbi:hypothetical protein V7S43_016508 [Phytophthora oleae]|uniref:Uncharacterized protein n=1 Tax=Phytophthora oleae TaxID=2107226 RepID=A0ABD3F0A8_9STRA
METVKRSLRLNFVQAESSDSELEPSMSAKGDAADTEGETKEEELHASLNDPIVMQPGEKAC